MISPFFPQWPAFSACMDNPVQKRPRILVIDDDPSVINALTSILRTAGYEVVEARNGRQGIRIALSEPVELVITDLVMPEQDGLETIMILRDQQPHVRIIATGEKTHDLYLSVAQRLGAWHTLTKPLHTEQVLDLVQLIFGSDKLPVSN